MNTQTLFRVLALAALAFALMLSLSSSGPGQPATTIPYSEFLAEVKTARFNRCASRATGSAERV